MIYLVMILAAIAVYSGVTALCAERGRRADTVRGRLKSLSGDANSRFLLDEELEQPLLERFVKPLLTSAAAFFGRLVPRRLKGTEETRARDKNKRDEALRKLLSQAGLAISPANYRILRGMIMLASAAALAAVGLLTDLDLRVTVFLAAIGPLASYVAVRYITAALATRRKQSLERGLPDILDILSISVEAGLGFEQALGHITQNMTGPMVDEFSVAYREMSMGRTRRDALQALSDRCDFDDLRTFTGAVIQAGQLGISIKNVLRSQSAAMRLSRKTRAQERAQKISTKILIPMLVFIFPVLFVILLGPAAVNILETLG